jgi:hypothetical protein
MNWNWVTLYKWILINILILSCLVWVGNLGVFEFVVMNDPFFISRIILILYVAFTCLGSMNAFYTSKDLNDVMNTQVTSYDKYDTEQIGFRIYRRLNLLELIRSYPILLGILGTILGMTLISTGVDISAIATSKESAVKVLSVVLEGILTALITTGVGIVFTMILSLQFYILQKGSDDLYLNLIKDKNV